MYDDAARLRVSPAPKSLILLSMATPTDYQTVIIFN